jgi:hypothetical protein
MNGCTVYSFRFPNSGNPELYRSFNTSAHQMFQPIDQNRHGLSGWYRFTGSRVPDDVDRCLQSQRVLQNAGEHTTSIFINQVEGRLDIEFNLQSTHERITIIFESGTPRYQRSVQRKCWGLQRSNKKRRRARVDSNSLYALLLSLGHLSLWLNGMARFTFSVLAPISDRTFYCIQKMVAGVREWWHFLQRFFHFL